MKITSSAFENNQPIPKKYSCQGEDINPPLKFEEVSAQAKSLVLIMDDPDAPGGTWVHWVVYNINPKTTEIAENSLPTEATVGQNSWPKNSYGGPCPPSGTHRYFFKLYALNKALDLDSRANKSKVEDSIQDALIDQAELVGLYSKK